MRRFMTGAVLCAIGLLLGAQTADAHTCASACNQIRRACNHSVQATRQDARALCVEEEEACHAGCEANADTCVPECDGTQTTCIAACAGDTLCEAACGEAHTACVDDCINCDANCDTAQVECRLTAEQARSDGRDTCTTLRTSCRDECVDPIDSACVRSCGQDQRGCRAAAKRAEIQCKKACERGNGRRACVRTCRRERHQDLQICSDAEALCIGGCIGLATP